MTTETTVDLYPCPFCGKSQIEKDEHAPECFFTIREALRLSGGADVVAARSLDRAWKTRHVPFGHKLVNADIGFDAKNALDRKHPNLIRYETKKGGAEKTLAPVDVKETVFPVIFQELTCAWTSANPSSSDAAKPGNSSN